MSEESVAGPAVYNEAEEVTMRRSTPILPDRWRKASILEFLTLVWLVSGSGAFAARGNTFSPNPGATAVAIEFGPGGGSRSRYVYQIFGDGRLQGQRFDSESRRPVKLWSTRLSRSQLAELERDVFESGLGELDANRMNAIVASRGPVAHSMDAPTLLIAIAPEWGTDGTRGAPTSSLVLEGGAAFASLHQDVPELGAAHRVLQLLELAREPAGESAPVATWNRRADALILEIASYSPNSPNWRIARLYGDGALVVSDSPTRIPSSFTREFGVRFQPPKVEALWQDIQESGVYEFNKPLFDARMRATGKGERSASEAAPTYFKFFWIESASHSERVNEFTLTYGGYEHTWYPEVPELAAANRLVQQLLSLQKSP